MTVFKQWIKTPFLFEHFISDVQFLIFNFKDEETLIEQK